MPNQNGGNNGNGDGASDPPAPVRLEKPVAFSLHVCAFVLGATALFFGRDVALPILLSILLALTLMPIVRWLSRRGIPSGLSATGMMLGLATLLLTAAWILSGPISHWMEQAPTIGYQIKWKLEALRGSVEALENLEKQVSEIAASQSEGRPTEVVVREPGFLSNATSAAWSTVTTLALTLILSLFLLASGDMVYEKIIRVLPTMSDKKAALRVVHDIESSISRYLLTVTVINACLGVAIGIAMWLLGMPNPLLWGLAAMTFNYLPYVGAVAGILLVGVVSLLTFDTVGQAALVPAVYFLLTAIEGNLITPYVVGRRLELNTVAIFVGVAFWGWVWGLAGVLIAVPFLVALKRLGDHLPSWSALGEFLAAPSPPRVPEPEPEPAAKEAA